MVTAAIMILLAGTLILGWLLLQRRLHRWGAAGGSMALARTDGRRSRRRVFYL
ncbi:MAG TPA: hypothetical protein VD969_08785 [Symbiobacteriaceae bacterium]|nr:hypothetical protein [Symbiobacteriaceae bacterium]